jgi:hypothetical protein
MLAARRRNRHFLGEGEADELARRFAISSQLKLICKKQMLRDYRARCQ